VREKSVRGNPDSDMREREGFHVSSSHCTVKLVNKSNWSMEQQSWSNVVKQSKTGQRKGVYFQILIFLDVSAKLDYRIENGLFRKLIQLLFGDNLSDIFK